MQHNINNVTTPTTKRGMVMVGTWYQEANNNLQQTTNTPQGDDDGGSTSPKHMQCNRSSNYQHEGTIKATHGGMTQAGTWQHNKTQPTMP